MENPAKWEYTDLIGKTLKDNPFYEERTRESRHGYWQGRRIIGRDTPINGGVYLVGGIGEAIVVDDTKQPELLHAYQELVRRRRARMQPNEPFNVGILDEVFDFTRELLPYDQPGVDRLVAQLQINDKVTLSSFMINKAGVCRHQALLAGYLLEKLKADGYIRGKVSVDRNFVEGKGGHAWVRYVNSIGEVFIIDPAQNFIGKIDEAGANQWFYERPSANISEIRKLVNVLKRKITSIALSPNP